MSTEQQEKAVPTREVIARAKAKLAADVVQVLLSIDRSEATVKLVQDVVALLAKGG